VIALSNASFVLTFPSVTNSNICSQDPSQPSNIYKISAFGFYLALNSQQRLLAGPQPLWCWPLTTYHLPCGSSSVSECSGLCRSHAELVPLTFLLSTNCCFGRNTS
jgi:hypothetical protein